MVDRHAAILAYSRRLVNRNHPGCVFFLTVGFGAYRIGTMTPRAFREKYQLTAEQAADRCGIKRSTWAMIETGGGCRADTAKRIIDGTNGEVTLDDLVEQQDKPPQVANE